MSRRSMKSIMSIEDRARLEILFGRENIIAKVDNCLEDVSRYIIS